MAKKMSRRTVILGLSAITTVYLAGYAVTEPAARQIAQAETSGVATSPVATPRATAVSAASISSPASPAGVAPTPVAQSTLAPPSPTAQPTQIVPQPTTAPATNTSGLANGTFVGLGRSRRGDVQVTLTIQGGKIVTADISQCMTQYPQSVIDGLPAQVVERQSAEVDLVSGATYSSRAFQDAVRQALAESQQSAGSAA